MNNKLRLEVLKVLKEKQYDIEWLAEHIPWAHEKDHGHGKTLEIFADGTYRVLGDWSIGNLYESKGCMISLPALADLEHDDFDEDGFPHMDKEEHLECSSNVDEWFREMIEEYEN